MKKIKAFTILELTITMALSSVVFAMGWAGYQMIQRQFFLFQSIQEKVSEEVMMSALLKKDITFSSELRWTGEQLLAIYPERGMVSYTFNRDIVIRAIPQRTDTFHVPTGDLEVFYRHKTIQESESLVDEVRLQIPGEPATNIRARKDYGIAVLIAEEENHEY